MPPIFDSNGIEIIVIKSSLFEMTPLVDLGRFIQNIKRLFIVLYIISHILDIAYGNCKKFYPIIIILIFLGTESIITSSIIEIIKEYFGNNIHLSDSGRSSDDGSPGPSGDNGESNSNPENRPYSPETGDQNDPSNNSSDKSNSNSDNKQNNNDEENKKIEVKNRQHVNKMY